MEPGDPDYNKLQQSGEGRMDWALDHGYLCLSEFFYYDKGWPRPRRPRGDHDSYQTYLFT